MKITINGQLYFDNSLDYNHIHQMVNDNSYNSIGEAITTKLSEAIQNTEWYHHAPNKMDVIKNFDHVQMVCGNDNNCWADAANWTIMNKTELTSDIYKFITDRMAVMREGFQYNFWPKDHLQHVLNLIDWHFILDCVSWFL